MKSSNFAGATLNSLTRALSHALISEETARRRGLMQALDPRVRVLGILALVIAVALAHKIAVVLALFVIAIVLARASSISIRTLSVRVWLVALAFTGIIALPAVFLTPGQPVFPNSSVTLQGLCTAAMLVSRVEAAVTLTTVLVLSTPWTEILKALRALHVPKEAVMMLGMAHRYIFLLAETATQMFESRQSRTVGVIEGRQQRKLAARTAGVLMSKSIDLSQEVFLAMQSRGYRGEVHIAEHSGIHTRDWAALGSFIAIAVIAIRAGW